MRTLVKSNRYTITGDRTIAVTYYEFTAQDIRLIYNETQDEILVSSGLKIGVVVENGIITLSENTPIMNVNDILTIEIDSVQNCEGLSIEMNEGKSRVSAALTMKGQNSTPIDTYEQLAQKVLAITGDVTVTPLDGWNSSWHDLAYEVSQWNDAEFPFSFAILLTPGTSSIFLYGADKYKLSDGRILTGAQSVNFMQNEVGRESKLTKYVIYRTSTPYFAMTFGNYANTPLNNSIIAAYNYMNDMSAISFTAVNIARFINDASVVNPLVFGGDRKLITLQSLQFDSCGISKFVFPEFSIDASDLEKSLAIPSYFFRSSTISEVVFPNQLKTLVINDLAFHNCGRITHLIFPENLQSLSTVSNSFQSCTGLVSLNFPNSLRSLSLGSNTFRDCFAIKSLLTNSGLLSITIGSGCFLNTTFAYIFLSKSISSISGVNAITTLVEAELENGWMTSVNLSNTALVTESVKSKLLDRLADKRGDGVNSTTATMTTTSSVITFINGNCLNIFRPGDTITLVGGTVRTILSVDSQNQVTLTANGSHNLTNVAYNTNKILTLSSAVKANLATVYGASWADEYTNRGWTIA
jgi:hypothetical protein